MKRDLVTLVAAFAIGTGAAWVLGATNTGTAMFFGQMAFAATLVFILVRRA